MKEEPEGEEEEEEDNSAEVEMYRKKIVGLYKQYNPEKVGDVARLMGQYKGNEDKLYNAIKKKYVGQVEAKIKKIYEKHNPEKLGDVARLMDKFQGNELKLLEAITKKYAQLSLKEKEEEEEGGEEDAKAKDSSSKSKKASADFPKIKAHVIKRMKPHVLKDKLQERGLSIQGTKKELMDRLVAWQEENC